jgi:hypothetical protein
MSDLLSCTTKLNDATCLIRVLCRISGMRGLMEWSIPRIFFSSGCSRVLYVCFPYGSHTKDGMLYSRWTCHGLWCRHVLPYVCIPHAEYARQGYTPFKRRVSEVGRCHASAWCMDTISIVNGNVCGRFRDVLAWKVIFCRYTTNNVL